MNDKLEQLYNLYKQNGIIQSTDFNTFSSADENQRRKLYDLGKQKGLFNTTDYNTFNSAFQPVKKKETTVSPSVQKPKPISSDIQPKGTQKPLDTSVSKNKVEVFTNFPTKEDNQYRIINNNWQRKEPGKDWTTVKDSNAIIGLNKQYKKNIVPTEGFEGISGKLIDNEEETVVPYLQKNYGRLGFNFEQTGAGDRIKVVTQDGKNSEVFMLDNWTDEGDSSEAVRLKAWLKENVNTIDRERYNKVDEEISAIKNITPKQRESLKSDAFSNMSTEIPDELALDIKTQLKLKEKEKEAMQYNKSRMDALMTDINKAKQTKGKEDDAEVRARVAAVYGNKDEIAKQNRYISNSLNDIARVSVDLNRKSKEYDEEVVRWQADLEKNNGIETPELTERKLALEGRAEMLNKEVGSLDENLKLSKSYQTKLDDIAGEYMLFKEGKGSTGGAMINNFLKGATNIWRFAGLERSSQEELIKLIGSDYTTQEFATSKERSDIEKVLFSLSNSVGAAVGGLGVGTLPSFYAQTYYDVKDEIDDNPDFNGVPELEKTLVASTIGLTVGWLEKFGLDKLMSKNPISKTIVNRILLKTVGDLPKDATAEMLEQAINTNVKALLAKGAINVAGGAFVEGSTEFAQEFAEGSIKNLYNAMKGKKMFEEPESLLAQSFEAAYLGAMGGAIMQSPIQATKAITDGISNKNKLAIEILEKSVTDSELRSMMVTKIKTQIINGELTKEEGQKQIDAVNETANTFEKLPDNITDENRSKSFDLLIERSKIEKEIAGKDENLVATQKARIADINNELKTISENATKESTKPVEEVTAEGGGVQYQGVKEGQPEVGQGERPVGETAQPSPDLGNRPVEGRSVQEEKITSDLENKINQYETEQAAEGIGTEETVTTDEGKEVKRVKLREPKESNARTALTVDTGNNPRLAVLKYFVGGGKINSTAIQKLFGNQQGKTIKGEVQSRIGLIDNKKGLTPERIAESLWMEYGEQFGMTDADFLPYVEEVISEFKGTKGMISELLSVENKSEEDYYKQMYGDSFEGYDNSEIEQAESVLDYMTDEEIIQMANDIEVAEKEFIEEKLKQEATVEQPVAEEPKTIDKAISFLEDLENKLDKFGKETLGVNIPVAVLKSAVNVAKTSLKAGKQIADAISDAVDYIKSTDFYKNITEEDKSKIESDVNDLFTGKKTFEDISEVKEKTIEKLSDLIGENKKDVKTIVSISKENNFSDNIIRDYIKQQGYSDKEATNAINEYNIKKEDIWIANKDTRAKSIASSLKSFRKRLFSARSFLPKSVFGYKEKKDAEIARELNIVDQNVTDFNRLYAKYKGDQEQLLKDFDAYIRGDKTVELPEEFMDTADSMRNQIDNLSRQLIDNGLVDADMAQKIKDNLGQYLTRSYKLYDRENWKSEVEEEVKQKAINFLRSQYRSMAQELADKEGIPVDEVLDNIVNNKVDEMLTTEGASNFIKGSKLGAKDLSVLKEKQDIPFEIRALMGEYSDPALNYAKTVLKLSSLAANHNFLTEVKNAGMGVYLFEKNDPRRPAEFNTMIAAEGSKGMNPLNGLYTTKEIAKSFEAQASQLSDFMKLFMKFQSSIRWAKTIGSIATHMKNVIGNLGFVWTNGHFDPKALSASYKIIKNDFAKGNRQELRDKMNNYISLGIVKQSAGLGEIMDMFKDADWDTAMASRLSNQKIGILGKAKRFLLQGKKKLEDAYQAEDDFFKIIAYENELSRYSEAMFDKDKKDLTEDELKQVNDVVTEIVKNTYPTYDRIPEAIKMIRRAPFIGNFVSFQAEAYRTAFNTMALAKSELESDNPKIKLIGAKRLAGATSYVSAKTAILQYFSMAAGTGLTGVIGYLFDDDDEEQRDKDIREFVAPWSKESDLIVLNVADGKLKYIDFSASDPHGGIKKAMNAFLLGESTTDSFIDGIISTVSPFIGEEMTTEALLELKNNQDKYGKQIWNPEENLQDQSKKILAHIYKLVEPGTFSSIRRGVSSENKAQELVANITGFRTYDVDINEQFGFKVRDYSERIKNAKKIYNSVFYNEESTKKQKEDAYNKANESLSNIYQEIIDIYDSAERLGVDPKDLKNTMNDFGNISKRDAFKIKKGEIPSLKLKR